VRDPWSLSDLRGLPNVRQVPDLAVLEMAEHFAEVVPVDPGGTVGFVARRVDHAAGYEATVTSVAAELGDAAVWAVQAAGDRTKSDAVHYERLGVVAEGGLPEMLASGSVSVVVSVRLHGALMALRAGVPAIHLAYDRKGPAAFADLGLDAWCLDVRSLDAGALRARIDGLRTDPSAYWRAVETEIPRLVERSGELDEVLRRAIATV
jgi:hypothetical protein